MNAEEAYQAGRLQEAVDAQIQAVKANPGDAAGRLFLFELLAFTGDLERARRQIDAVEFGDPDRDMAVLSYRQLLQAEEARRKVFAQGTAPEFLIEPPAAVRRRLEAADRLRQGQHAEAAEILAEADAASAPVRGKLNGKPFEGLRDCDDLLGPVLEVMAKGKYFWIPLEQVESLAVNEPRFPRDLVWSRAFLVMRDGPAGDLFLPTLYPGSHEQADDRIRLGRMTDWKTPDVGPVQGLGLRMFLVGEDPMTVLEWRQLEIDPPPAPAADGP